MEKLKAFVEDEDQNLKYLGLLAMGNFMKVCRRCVRRQTLPVHSNLAHRITHSQLDECVFVCVCARAYVRACVVHPCAVRGARCG